MANGGLTLEQQAEVKYPMPVNPCPWNKKRVLWMREKWVKEQKLLVGKI